VGLLCCADRIALWNREDAKSAKIIAKKNSNGLPCGLCVLAVSKELT
jgi:cytidine deaminase